MTTTGNGVKRTAATIVLGWGIWIGGALVLAYPFMVAWAAGWWNGLAMLVIIVLIAALAVASCVWTVIKGIDRTPSRFRSMNVAVFAAGLGMAVFGGLVLAWTFVLHPAQTENFWIAIAQVAVAMALLIIGGSSMLIRAIVVAMSTGSDSRR